MRSFLRSMPGSLAALCILASSALMCAEPAYAAVALLSVSSLKASQDYKLVAFGDVTAAQTFATASFADVTGSSFSFTPTRNDSTSAALKYPSLIKVTWSFDVTKATATTGSCAVFVNGALVTASTRTSGLFANAYTIGGVLVVANTVVGAQTVKMQCKSADTNVFTLTNGHVVVEEVILS